MLRTFAILVLLNSAWFVAAADRPSNRVLFIGLDGTRTDALDAAKAPNLKAIMKSGAVSKQTNILGSRGDSADTCSGPGWSNLLTGVWPDKHGIMDNDFKTPHYDKYPHFFAHVKEVFPGAKTYAYSTWPAISAFIDRSADESICFQKNITKPDYPDADEKCAAKAVETLNNGDPDVMFVYLGQIDETGHAKGFHPTVRPYMQAIATVDGHIGQILEAMRSRLNFKQENWLVLVSTDHGGRGTNHGGGRSILEINTVFLIVSGDAAASGNIEGPTNQVDLVATALKHLGTPLKPEWELDGKPVGLK